MILIPWFAGRGHPATDHIGAVDGTLFFENDSQARRRDEIVYDYERKIFTELRIVFSIDGRSIRPGSGRPVSRESCG